MSAKKVLMVTQIHPIMFLMCLLFLSVYTSSMASSALAVQVFFSRISLLPSQNKQPK